MPDIKHGDAVLSGMGERLPSALLSRLKIEEYLDQLGRAEVLAAGERTRLGELLAAVERPAPTTLDETAAGQRQGDQVPIGTAGLTQREHDVIDDFRRRRAATTTGLGEFALGNILVANGQITRTELEGALLRQELSGRRLGEELITAGHASLGQIEGGLLLQRRLISWALAVTVGIAPLAALATRAEAAQRSAAIHVSVAVVAGAKLRSSHQATQVRISEGDIARGHVEVPVASRFSVASNSRSGYRLDFYPLGDFFESVHVAGLGNVVRFGAEGGTIVQRGPLLPNLTHELSFRFTLRPGTLPGVYPWPLQLSVRGL